MTAKIERVELRAEFEDPFRVRLSQRRFPASYSLERSGPGKVPQSGAYAGSR
jgi:hypothetical protein